jgi:hypothetical protein
MDCVRHERNCQSMKPQWILLVLLVVMIVAGTQDSRAQDLLNNGTITNPGTLKLKQGVSGMPSTVDGVVVFFGGSQDVPASSYRHLRLAGSGTKTTVGDGLAISDTLTIVSGVRMDHFSPTPILLSGLLAEQGYLAGRIRKTVTLSVGTTSSDFGRIGLSINWSGAAPGVTTVTRSSGAVLLGNGNSSIKRFYEIVPTNTAGTTSSLVFAYSSNELDGQDPSTLTLWRSIDAGGTWRRNAGVRDTSARTITTTTAFLQGIWTASDTLHPLGPVAIEGVPADIVQASFDSLSGPIGSSVGPMTIAVLDSYGNPVAGASVAFAITSTPSGAAGDSLLTTSAVTDANGTASTTLRLGNRVGVYDVTATAAALPNASVVFSASARHGTPASLAIVSGNSQQGLVNSSLVSPFVVLVTDAGQNPVAGDTVAFMIVQFPDSAVGQQLSAFTVLTDSSGHAHSVLTFGNRAGTYGVRALVVHLALDSVLFTATANNAPAPLFTLNTASLNFGNVAVGDSATLSILVRNTGTAALTISQAISSQPRFTITPTNAVVPAGDSAVFTAKFRPNIVGAAAGTIVFTHNADGSPDSVNVTGTGTLFTLTVEVVHAAGWNLLANPVTTADDSVRQIYPTARLPYAFGYTSGVGYVQEYRLANRRGYWERFGEPTSAHITGIARLLDTIFVVAGWNLIGSISEPVDTSTIVSNPPGIRTSNWLGYNASYVPATEIIPGKGYWVRTNQAGSFVFSASLAPGTQTNATNIRAGSPIRFNEIVITDAAGNRQTLYFGSDPTGSIDAEMFAMPPVAPEGIFDTRFTTELDGYQMRLHPIEVHQRIEFPISIHSAVYPVTLAWNIEQEGPYTYSIGDAIGGRILTDATIRATGELRIENSALRRLLLSVNGAEELPTEFALHQNYPNPFNATTFIVYDVPGGIEKSARVTIEVYNSVGQRIRILTASEHQPGRYRLEWSGADEHGKSVPSGVYFYRMVAGSFVSTMKMMMLK